VLHKALQDHPGSASKWKSRCWQGVYLGHSPQHAGNVALVYTHSTKHVTPQFHLSFDDTFSSVQGQPNQRDTTIEAILERTAWLYRDDFAASGEHHHFTPDTTDASSNIAPPVAHIATQSTLAVPPSLPHGCTNNSTGKPKYCPVAPSAAFAAWKTEQGISADVFQAVPPSTPPTGSTQGATLSYSKILNTPTPVPEGATPLPSQQYAFTTTTVPTPGDTLTQSAMLKAPDKLDFVQAQVTEIHTLHDAGVFSYHPIHTLPPKARLLNAIWSYRRKRTPAGVYCKHKARICTNGSQQQYGVNYWNTYAPVVSWSSVRILLTLSHIHRWHSTQIDFTQAFTQPPIKDDVYMHIPQGWHVVNNSLQQHPDPKYRDATHYIKLEKSLYGIKQAAHTWFHHLEPGLIKLGFTASAVDPYLFYRHDCIICLYVDDCLLFSPDATVIPSVLAALCTEYHIGEEGTVQDFLGVHLSTSPEGALTFQQPAIVQSILQDLGLQTCHPKPTPAIAVLHPDHGGFDRTEAWNYRSVIGKLNYLAQMSRPDISMAVHNCARFSAHPTYLHEQAVKRIGRYLYSTQDKGLIYRPSTSATLDMYVDADFAGTWHKEYAHLRESVLSRTGYVILYHGCPIHWGSKLQTEIALSTTKAEYIALSMGARELIPLRHLLRELQLGSPLQHLLPHPSDHLPPSTIFKDNASCIAVATREVLHKPRTKHIALKYHHFKDYLQSGALQIVKVPTASNLADIFTKPLTQVLHERLWQGMMGW
jgi:hypothetical protein